MASPLEIFVIAGLGNPGRQYEATRHNIGFMFVDALASAAKAGWRSGQNLQYAEARLGAQEVILLKPETYMNLSGEAVAPFVRYRKWQPEHVVAVHDEIDLPYGNLRIKKGGGHGGHNGIRSLETHLGTGEFYRMRLGVSRPPPGAADEVVRNWVLGRFSSEESRTLSEFLERGAQALITLAEQGLAAAQNRFNT